MSKIRLRKHARLSGIAFVAIAAVLLLVSVKLPLWHMHMEGPQYRDEEALRVRVFPDSMQGDLQELAVLNQYIGVHVPETLPQFKWLPLMLATGAALGILAALLPAVVRSRAVLVVTLGVALALTAAAVQARSQMHEIGHNRDPHAAMAGFRDFTPPLIGKAKIAQFEVTSMFGSGAWLIGLALSLQVTAAWLLRGAQQPARGSEASALNGSFSSAAASSRS